MKVIRVNAPKARRIMGLYAIGMVGVSIWYAVIPGSISAFAFIIFVLFGPALTCAGGRYHVMGNDREMLRVTRVYPPVTALMCLAGVCVFELFSRNLSIFRATWPCALPWLGLPMIVLQWMAITTFVPRFDRVRRFPRADECPNCLYDLSGNTSGRCPECGRELDEAQRRTIRSRSRQ